MESDQMESRITVETTVVREERMVDFGSDVSAVKDFNKLLDDLMTILSTESFDSGVSFKSDQSKAGLIDFKDRVSPRWWDFGSDVSAVEDFNKLLKNLMSMRSTESSDSGVSSNRARKRSRIMRAEREAQRDKERWWDFGSDVSAVEDFNKLLKNLARHRPGAVV